MCHSPPKTTQAFVCDHDMIVKELPSMLKSELVRQINYMIILILVWFISKPDKEIF